MPEDLKGLIEQIQKEGVQAAEDKAKEIETQANRKAQELLDKAHKEAEKIIAAALAKNAKTQAAVEASLQQAARDVLIALRKEMLNTLERLAQSSLRKALGPAELAGIIKELIKAYRSQGKEAIAVLLATADFEKVEKGFMAELSDEMKKGITLKPSQDIQGGFMISYDSGKSYYNFTDQALREYFMSYLGPKFSQLLSETTPNRKKT